MQIIIPSLQQIDCAVDTFVSLFANHRIFAFYGGMGAGKTTFIKAVCERLGVLDNVASPTFAIVNEYALPPSTGGSVYHFDFYRIKNLAEVYDIGYEDYFYSGQLCFIEWPELIEDLLPDDAVRVDINVAPDDRRTLTVTLPS